MAPAAASLDQEDNTITCKTVCVMDASGPLGSNLVHRLIHAGFSVHAALQRRNDGGELLMVKGYDKKKLKIFNFEPLDYHSIIEALRGCSGLFYTFQPPADYLTYDYDDDEIMGEMEVRAAHNVLEACAQTETIEKVVFTSSITAVIWRDRPNSNSNFDENFWTDVHFCRKFKLWHGMWKTLSERTAWALARDRGVNMVSINAGLLTTTSDLTIHNPYLKGAAEMYENGLFVTVDLNFLVEAHIRVFLDVSSYGRYICFNHVINRHEDAADLARKLTPSSPQSEEHCLKMVPQRISNQKLTKLMVDFNGDESQFNYCEIIKPT